MSEPRTTYIGLAIIIAGLVVYGGLQIQQLTPVAHSAAVQTVPPSNNWAFPHTTLYGGGSSSGWPFTGNESDLQAPIGAPLNPTVIADYARFPMIIIPITPSGDTRPDILAALRQQNPQQKIFAYVHATGIWCPADSSNNNSYPMNGFYRQEYLDATFGDPSCASKSSGLLWMQDGTSATNNLNGAGMNMNLAHRIDLGGGNYQYDVADALATTAATYAIQSHNYDGLFLDVFCPDIQWMDPIDPNQPYVSPTNFDYVKAGYGVDKDANGKYINDQASHDAFHAGWQAGQQAYTEKLRALAIANGQPNYPISGNCAQAPTRLQPYLNGWMREGFPFQNWYAGAANFYSNMLAWPWGYLHQDQDFLLVPVLDLAAQNQWLE